MPYCLIFFPEEQDLQLYHLESGRYRPVPANTHGRHAIPELELEVGLLDGWVRFWYQGEILLLVEEMEKERIQLMQRTEENRQVRRPGQATRRPGANAG